MRKLFAILALATLVAACSERPTAVNDEGPPGPSFMQTLASNDTMPPGNGWTLIYYEDASDPATSPYVYEVSCLGAGNSVQFLKWWWWSKDFVTSPSGNMHATQRVTWNSGGYIAPNGDFWQLQKMLQPLIARWDRVGLEWVAQNTGEVWYVNTRTGQRMKETSKYVLRFPEMPPPVPNFTGFEVLQSHCQLMGPE